MEIWAGDSVWRVRSFTVRRDSAVGLQVAADSTCATCPIAMPLSKVDSLRTRSSDRNWLILPAAAGLFALYLALSWGRD